MIVIRTNEKDTNMLVLGETYEGQDKWQRARDNMGMKLTRKSM